MNHPAMSKSRIAFGTREVLLAGVLVALTMLATSAQSETLINLTGAVQNLAPNLITSSVPRVTDTAPSHTKTMIINQAGNQVTGSAGGTTTGGTATDSAKKILITTTGKVNGCDPGLRLAPLAQKWWCPPGIDPDSLISVPLNSFVNCASYVGSYGIGGGATGMFTITTENNPKNANFGQVLAANTSSCVGAALAVWTAPVPVPAPTTTSCPATEPATSKTDACAAGFTGGITSARTNSCVSGAWQSSAWTVTTDTCASGGSSTGGGAACPAIAPATSKIDACTAGFSGTGITSTRINSCVSGAWQSSAWTVATDACSSTALNDSCVGPDLYTNYSDGTKLLKMANDFSCVVPALPGDGCKTYTRNYEINLTSLGGGVNTVQATISLSDSLPAPRNIDFLNLIFPDNATFQAETMFNGEVNMPGSTWYFTDLPTVTSASACLGKTLIKTACGNNTSLFDFGLNSYYFWSDGTQTVKQAPDPACIPVSTYNGLWTRDLFYNKGKIVKWSPFYAELREIGWVYGHVKIKLGITDAGGGPVDVGNLMLTGQFISSSSPDTGIDVMPAWLYFGATYTGSVVTLGDAISTVPGPTPIAATVTFSNDFCGTGPLILESVTNGCVDIFGPSLPSSSYPDGCFIKKYKPSGSNVFTWQHYVLAPVMVNDYPVDFTVSGGSWVGPAPNCDMAGVNALAKSMEPPPPDNPN